MKSCKGCMALRDKGECRIKRFSCALKYDVSFDGMHSEECPRPENQKELLQASVKK